MSEIRDRLIVQPLTGYPASIGAALWRLVDSRARTLEAIQDASPPEMDWQAPGLQNSIGTLLYHIAAIEMDWLYDEVLGQDWSAEIQALFPHPVRDPAGRLHPVLNVRLSDHLARFTATRQVFLDSFKGMTPEDYACLRELPRYDVSPGWVLHHLAQHEDEHRGEISTIRTLYKAAQQTS